MKWINRIVDWLVLVFGGIVFISLYNVGTVFWYLEGRYNPNWFDPFPSNFYTFLVSWLAINMTSFVLWAERRNKDREDREHKRDQHMTEAILHLSESSQQILKYLLEQETGIDLDEQEGI